MVCCEACDEAANGVRDKIESAQRLPHRRASSAVDAMSIKFRSAP
jgi:hypothetical protein